VKPNLLGQTEDQLRQWLSVHKKPGFAAQQIIDWLYVKGCRSFEEMSNLSKALRSELAAQFTIDLPSLALSQTSRDGTVKFLCEFGDGKQVESVLLTHEDHHTLCVSTQVGCAMGCKFCRTATMGLVRHLDASEIVGQVLLAQQILGPDKRLRNLVFMGMGEPFHNYDNLIRSLEILLNPKGLDYSWRRITVSTSGLTEAIVRFWEETSVKAMLAISLNGVTQEARQLLMPVTKKNHLEDLIETCRQLPLEKRQRITFEYILLADVTDDAKSAKQLVALLNGIKAKVNLIPFNPDPALPFKAPSAEKVREFQNILTGRGLLATVRKSRGQDVGAACGQLASENQTVTSN